MESVEFIAKVVNGLAALLGRIGKQIHASIVREEKTKI